MNKLKYTVAHEASPIAKDLSSKLGSRTVTVNPFGNKNLIDAISSLKHYHERYGLAYRLYGYILKDNIGKLHESYTTSTIGKTTASILREFHGL
jgi:hypothetical protein